MQIVSSSRISDTIDPSLFDESPDSALSDAPETHPESTGIEERARGYVLRRPGDGSDGRVEQEDWIAGSFQARKRRWIERKTGLTKSWANESPNKLLFKCTGNIPDQDAWRRKVALMRSVRMPIAVLQMMIRRDILEKKENRDLLQLLPRGEQRRKLMGILASNGYSRQDVRDSLHVIDGDSDHERCDRFLALKGHRPIWLFHFVIRPAAKLRKAETVAELIAYCSATYDGRRDGDHDKTRSGSNKWKAKDPMQSMDPAIFCHTLKYLASHCMLHEPRLLVSVGDLATQYITNMNSWSQHPARIYQDQCFLFNRALGAFAPSVKSLPPKWYRNMAHYWAPQRKLLAKSAAQEKPFVVNKQGFESIREVLAGLEKDPAELHNSDRHAQTWPPYLEIGDGIDEMTKAEDNWSRTVTGGTLQQEDGYPLTKQDQALDILQGRAVDDTPTIQQRLVRPLHRSMSLWEASIRATRNAEEAWARFRQPPDETSKPTVHEYGAVFAKLCAPDAPPDSILRPGDKTLNFPVRHNPNLSEFALSQMSPPSVADLYQDMRLAGILPEGACLEVLLANAPTMEVALRYLRDTTETVWPLLNDTPGSTSARVLRTVRTPLLAAYVRMLCQIESAPGRHLYKAIEICDKRFEDDDESRVWAPYLWGEVLKAFSAKSARTDPAGRVLAEQIRVALQIVGKIEVSSVPRRSVVLQLGKSLRKAAARALEERISDVERDWEPNDSPLRRLYDSESRTPLAERAQSSHVETALTEGHDHEHPWLRLLGAGAGRLKGLLDGLVAREAEAQALHERVGPESVEGLLAREDAVLAQDAYQIMSAWAFLGEYEEMASYLSWVLRQWDSETVYEQLDMFTELPPYADFGDVICLFRLYAEPMLPEGRVSELREQVLQSRVARMWPNDNLVTAFLQTRENVENRFYKKLAHALEWIRYRQALERGEEPSTLLRPSKWRDPEIQWS